MNKPQEWRTTLTANQEIAQTILKQLGGGRFTSMTGAKDFVAIERGLRMRLPSNLTRDRITHFTVTLNANDTYLVVAHKVRGVKSKEMARVDECYCDQLREAFEDITGMVTSL